MESIHPNRYTSIWMETIFSHNYKLIITKFIENTYNKLLDT
ncbi:hypothetical protein BVIET440_60232 [Burkholderia vietnamiensis]